MNSSINFSVPISCHRLASIRAICTTNIWVRFSACQCWKLTNICQGLCTLFMRLGNQWCLAFACDIKPSTTANAIKDDGTFQYASAEIYQCTFCPKYFLNWTSRNNLSYLLLSSKSLEEGSSPVIHALLGSACTKIKIIKLITTITGSLNSSNNDNDNDNNDIYTTNNRINSRCTIIL